MGITLDDIIRKCENEANDFEHYGDVTDQKAASVLREIALYLKAQETKTISHYTDRIVAMAVERGWSQQLQHTLFKLVLETGEFCKAAEDFQLISAQVHKITPETMKMADIMRLRMMKEAGDIFFMLLQALRSLGLKPEDCIEYTIVENKKKKKKTIDENGNPVMR